MKVLANEKKKEKEMKYIQIEKEEIQLLLFIDDMTVYVENLKELTKNSRNK